MNWITLIQPSEASIFYRGSQLDPDLVDEFQT